MKVSRYQKHSDITYALGATVAMEFLLKAPGTVRQIIFHPEFTSDAKEDILKLAEDKGIPVETDRKAFNILSQKENCFVIAVISKTQGKLEAGNHMVLVNPSNAGNLGTIMRSCAGFGVTDIAIIPPAVDHYDPKTVRASMGALARVNVEVFATFEEYRERFPENNCYPFMLDGSTLLQETVIEKPFSLIMGNEATGLPAGFRDVGNPIRIEHTDAIDSLNLPIAASIGLYEATKDHFASNTRK
ncbi:RNA methyltransferase, TrmH family [Ruminococcaceae bacterium YRB3002]|nr:RNA methyltransferase, TrmH family [Ruminococcaceae bacterium YRB3002]